MDLDGTQTAVSTWCSNCEWHPSYAVIVGCFPCACTCTYTYIHIYLQTSMQTAHGIRYICTAFSNHHFTFFPRPTIQPAPAGLWKPEVSPGARVVKIDETALQVPAAEQSSPTQDERGSGGLDDTTSPTTLRHVRACVCTIWSADHLPY